MRIAMQTTGVRRVGKPAPPQRALTRASQLWEAFVDVDSQDDDVEGAEGFEFNDENASFESSEDYVDTE